ncbi:hypothetical protein NQ317_012599 [Molorchus minor]|uniref:Uncharacterized protein n=1 Tax=Molorchus minor TaxID=1323400 RepID=A0ABQ9JED0_9CUCU|nr:hypothetical protein NQ317_012599 [Molorchus minor]
MLFGEVVLSCKKSENTKYIPKLRFRCVFHITKSILFGSLLTKELNKKATEWECKYKELQNKYVKLEKRVKKKQYNNIWARQPSERPRQICSRLLKPVGYYKFNRTSISIAEELTLDERKENKILIQHLKKAWGKNLNAFIKNKTLYINGQKYTAHQLAQEEEDTETEEEEVYNNTTDNIEEIQKLQSNSAPSTPSTSRYSEEEKQQTEEVFTVESGIETKTKTKLVKDKQLPQKIVRSSARINSATEQFQFKFECIILTETFNINDKELHMFNIEGYQLIYNEGDINKNDGVIIYIRQNLNYNYDIIKINNINVIKLDILNIYKNDISILATYRSPDTSPTDFICALDTYLQNNKTETNYSIFIGDINIDILEPEKGICLDYLNILHIHGYKSYINEATREMNNSRTCLDHIFIKPLVNTTTTEAMTIPCIIQTKITDHYVTSIQIILNKEKVNLILSALLLQSKFPQGHMSYLKTNNRTQFFLYPTSPLEIAKIISELKPKKSPGIDGITTATLKEITVHIIEPLAYIINKSIAEGKCPSAFKVAVYLSLNLEKTKYLPFYLHEMAAPTFDQLVVDNNFHVTPVTEMKYLGIMIDNNLKWDAHVCYVTKKLRKLVYRFKCLKDILNCRQLKILYQSLVESHLAYGILGWGRCPRLSFKTFGNTTKKNIKNYI